eukprot:scaffold8825_cov58-Phaeocystis_antarctica.AAC.3
MTGWVQCRSEVRYPLTSQAALGCDPRRIIARPHPLGVRRGFWSDNAAINPLGQPPALGSDGSHDGQTPTESSDTVQQT